jgi:hypothetical protein
MGYKHLREPGLTAKNPTHFQDFHSHRYTFSHRSSCCQALGLSDQAAFTKEFVGTQERDNGLLSLLGHYGDFDLALFDVENCISGVALRKKDFSLSVRANGPTLGSGRQKGGGIKSPRARFCHRALVIFNFAIQGRSIIAARQSVQNCSLQMAGEAAAKGSGADAFWPPSRDGDRRRTTVIPPAASTAGQPASHASAHSRRESGFSARRTPRQCPVALLRPPLVALSRWARGSGSMGVGAGRTDLVGGTASRRCKTVDASTTEF